MRLAALTTIALLLTGCGNAANGSQPPELEDPWEGRVLSYYLPTGECHTCAFTITIEADGSAVYHRLGVDVAFTVDVPRLRGIVTETDTDELIVGTTDCGREVDGNAPVLELRGEKIDSCFRKLDPTHPLLAYLGEQLDTGRDLIGVDNPFRLADHPNPERHEELRNSGPPLEWPGTFDPADCPTGFAHVFLDLGSAWFASEPLEGACDL